MEINEMEPKEAVKLTNHRYFEELKVLHLVVAAGKSPAVSMMQSLEKRRQECEMAEEHMLRSLSLAPEDPDQIALPLDGAA